ncbi:MAG: aspartate aminotransferase family protein, partial [Terriglobia bacterium]
HAHAGVNRAVATSLAKGQLYAGQHPDEVALARLVCEVVPAAEMVRFSLSGSEAVQAAVRLARSATGRSKIIKFEGHYHGWFDNIFVSVHADHNSRQPSDEWPAVPMSSGQAPEAYTNVKVLPWNNLDAVERAFQRYEFAAVIMEPIMGNTSVILPRAGFLEKVRNLCTEHGTILTFDEVITGFRVALGGAQELLGVRPDLSIFAKALANGYPMSCLAGTRNFMDQMASNGVVHAGTYNANRVSCTAALATLQALRESNGDAYHRIDRAGTQLIEGLKSLARETGKPLHVQGLPAMFHTTFTEQSEIEDARGYEQCQLRMQKDFLLLLLEQGIRVTQRGTWFVSAAHTSGDVERTLTAARHALQSLQSATRVEVSPIAAQDDP